MTDSGPKPKSVSMEWTDERDVFMLREMMVSDVFQFKKGTAGRGEAWESITDNLNQIETTQFNIKDKRGVRDRWVLLRKKYKSKVNAEEAASGISVDDMTEKEVLIEELIGKEDSISEADTALNQQKKAKSTAEEIRKTALERMGETKRRKSTDASTDKGEGAIEKKRTRCNATPVVDFLQQKAKADQELRQQELEVKKKELENSQEMMQTMMRQQQQMNQTFLTIVQQLLQK